jgi:hypothetical protein
MIRKTGRSAQGVKLVTLDEGDLVAAACTVEEAAPDGDGENGEDVQGNLPLA